MRYRRGFVPYALLLAGAVAPFAAFGEDKSAAGEEPTIEATKTHIDFNQGKELFTRYLIDEKVAKPYFWPVNVLAGVPVTRAWPMAEDPEVKKVDHPHQKSLWFCHGDVIPEGLDFKKHFKNVAG